MRLKIKGKAVKTWQGVKGNPSTREFQMFTYTTSQTLTSRDIRIEFRNDAYISGGEDRNLYVDKVVLNGQSLETEASTVLGKGVWTGTECTSAQYHRSERMACNGYFQY
jgi:hypothetical protein